MEINLKQPELFKAIRQYLESQGFNTRGKEVTINVSGGRGNNGAWAAISIEDSDIPGYEANSDDAPVIAMEGGWQTAEFHGGDINPNADPSPAPADAAPVPEPELIGEPYPYAGMPAPEPSLETSDDDLFQMPTEHQQEEAKPAVPTTPSSLFDE